MYNKMHSRCGTALLLLMGGLPLAGKAQLSIAAQLRTRTEFRDGQGAPLPRSAKPAFFTSQRTRLTAGFTANRLKFGLSVQDVRVWGQDVSTINKISTVDNNGLMIHEAWAEVRLTDTVSVHNLSFKVGRQELNYDDGRLLGNLDWLQQARRHDALVFRYSSGKWAADAGFAYSQNREAGTGMLYNNTPPGAYAGNTNGGAMYKGLQYLHVTRKNATGHISLLALADQFPQYHVDTVELKPVKTYDPGVYSRFTASVFTTQAFSGFTLTGNIAYQGGKYADGAKVDGWLLSGQALYAFTPQLKAGLGADYTTGGKAGATSKAFDPLYGTPHKFWGHMDYYYAGSTFGATGLQDYYLRFLFKPHAKWSLQADGHRFFSASDITAKNRSFGWEADLNAQFALTPVIGFEAGYSYYRSTPALAAIKQVANAARSNQWAYLMINIKPSFLLK
ncbi:alginate export family protein [Chitinophaga sp.]|uniref:alginate export family protein n=2 Tax=Chitinophaga TaxID=79328 RepID=UPI002FDDCB74